MAERHQRGKKFFTVTQANATLPLVRAIVGDIADLAQGMAKLQERLEQQRKPGQARTMSREEIQQLRAEYQHNQSRLEEFIRELGQLQVELKDPLLGLVDFPSRLEGREVYLCWQLGEAEVAHWHELDAGFAGRQLLIKETTAY